MKIFRTNLVIQTDLRIIVLPVILLINTYISCVSQAGVLFAPQLPGSKTKPPIQATPPKGNLLQKIKVPPIKREHMHIQTDLKGLT